MAVPGDYFHLKRRQYRPSGGGGVRARRCRWNGWFSLSLNLMFRLLRRDDLRRGGFRRLRSTLCNRDAGGWLIEFRFLCVREPEVALMPKHNAQCEQKKRERP